jgi:SAM-dependent methyltransferase
LNSSISEVPSAGKGESYSANFFAGCTPGSLLSARAVLALLFEIYQPKSVIDVGCGQGTWLVAAEELGARVLMGIDGPWVDATSLFSKKIDFRSVDLEAPFSVPQKFDLCISVEVAEHLSAGCAGEFVKSLCTASDVVLFSAAIPQQGGTNHINERWQSFWAGLFDEAGYGCYDLIRAKVWADPKVESWYRQNLLLYVRRTHPLGAKLHSYVSAHGPLDIVHPEIYTGNLETLQRPVAEPSLRFCTDILGRWCRRQLSKLTDRTR